MKILHFAIEGMHCVVCQGHVNRAVSSLRGVSSVQVDLLGNSMTVEASDDLPWERIVSAVEKAGYKAFFKGGEAVLDEGDSVAEKETRALRDRFLVSLLLAIPVCWISMAGMLRLPLPDALAGSLLSAVIQFVLATPIVLVNRDFFIRGVRAAIHASPTMDTLVALAAGTGYLYALASLVFLGKTMVSFETPAMLLTLITLGKWLEGGAKGRTTAELRRLRSLAPATALLLRDGTEAEVPLAEVKAGDICIVKPGTAIPADGVVVGGHSSVNQAAVTGEFMPVDKQVGDQVIGATINQEGVIRVKVSAVGSESLFGKIITMVEAAGVSQAPVARLADRVCAYFVPGVLLVALATLVGWILSGASAGVSIDHAIAVLVISCPCALGLATPVAIMVGTGIGAKKGILFKNAATMERMSHVNLVVLDKTGTLTEGRPSVVKVAPEDGYDAEGVAALAASLEKPSEHPLGKAVVAFAENDSLELLPVEEFRTFPGMGVAGKVNNREYFCGNLKLLREKLPDCSATPQEVPGATPLYLFDCKRLIAAFWLEDTVRPEARDAICELQSMGVECAMLTGDRQGVADAVAQRTALATARGGLLPQDKAEWIADRRRDGNRVVAMVGDGINDAPALASADVGIAVGQGTDVAVDTADVVLMNSSLWTIPQALKLSRDVLRTIRQNLCWAFCYNVVAIPLAAGLLSSWGVSIPPWAGAAAMASSSLIVVSNALRLRRNSA